MAELNESVFVKCPYHRAGGYLAAYVNARIEGKTVITLRVPVGSAELKKDVIVQFARGADPMHMDQPWRVHWTPKDGGPYPDFDGELTVRADEDYSFALLELKGNYRPPGGALGHAFDDIAGSRVAAVTAQMLLRELGDAFEAKYKAEEAEKQGRAGNEADHA